MENGLNIHSLGSIIVPRLHDLKFLENVQLLEFCSAKRIRFRKSIVTLLPAQTCCKVQLIFIKAYKNVILEVHLVLG